MFLIELIVSLNAEIFRAFLDDLNFSRSSINYGQLMK